MNLNRYMRSIAYVTWSVGILGLLPGSPDTAEASNRPTIVSVTEHREGEITREFGRGALSRHLPLFMEEFEARDEQIFEVLWRAPERGLPAGIVVTFEYRQPYVREISKMSIEYDGEVVHDQIARFIVPADSIGRAGPVTAWRVRILRADRILAQQTSETWR